MSVARQLVDLSFDPAFREPPREVLHEAKRALVDMFGCAIGGYSGTASRIMREFAQDLGGAKDSTIIGSGEKTSCLNAALANGVMVRYLDFNDTYLIPVGKEVLGNHPGELIPAVLALGEQRETRGIDVLRTIVMGFELSARFNDACANASASNPTIETKGWNTDSRGAFLMPIIAGHLLGLDRDQMEHAVGIGGSTNMILGVLDATGEDYSMTKNLRFPRTAYGGIMAAMQAKRGLTGPKRVIEGNKGFVSSVMRGDMNLDLLLAPVTKFHIRDTIYKAVAADASTHGHVNATIALAKEHDIQADEVEKIIVKAGTRCVEHTGDPVKKYPQNKESADHSSYFLTAISIIDRRVGPNQYTPEKWNSSAVRELIGKITFEADPELDRFGRAGITEIHTKDGKVHSRRVDYPIGDPKNPMSDRDLEEKFSDMAQPFMTQDRRSELLERVYSLEAAASVHGLMQASRFNVA